MQVVKTLQVKVISIGPGKMRPTTDALMTVRAAATSSTAPVVPTTPTVKDCIQVAIATVDDSGRYINRTTLSLCEGKMVVGNKDVGAAPDSLNTAITTAFTELDNAISTLITADTLGL